MTEKSPYFQSCPGLICRFCLPEEQAVNTSRISLFHRRLGLDPMALSFHAIILLGNRCFPCPLSLILVSLGRG